MIVFKELFGGGRFGSFHFEAIQVCFQALSHHQSSQKLAAPVEK